MAQVIFLVVLAAALIGGIIALTPIGNRFKKDIFESIELQIQEFDELLITMAYKSVPKFALKRVLSEGRRVIDEARSHVEIIRSDQRLSTDAKQSILKDLSRQLKEASIEAKQKIG